MTAEWVVLCEGYHDRAFWQGLLLHRFALADVRRDNDGKAIDGGHHGYRSRGGRLIRIAPSDKLPGAKVPLEGLEALEQRYRHHAARLETKPKSIVICTDEDDATSAADAQAKVDQRLAGFAGVPHPSARLQLDEHTALRAMTWACDDTGGSRLPPAQCLERLIVASINEAYPHRGAAVATWLAERGADAPKDASSINKAFSWSHMAGWYAGAGCDTFLQLVWRDPAIAAQLETRLRQTEAWSIIEEIVA